MDTLTLPPTGRRVYAHVHQLTAACPGGCGTIAGPKLGVKAYNPVQGLWRCPTCGYTAYVGVIFWPRNKIGHAALPEDHVLTPGEAAALRLQLSFAETRDNRRPRLHGMSSKAMGPVNRVCTCGECPIHSDHDHIHQGDR